MVRFCHLGATFLASRGALNRASHVPSLPANVVVAFRERYGTLTAAGYQIPAPWQTALGFAAQLGSFFGVLISGTFINRIGYRYTHLIAYALLVLFVFICFFAVNLPMLFIGTVLCGVPWGML